jgi:hypothetical protein
MQSPVFLRSELQAAQQRLSDTFIESRTPTKELTLNLPTRMGLPATNLLRINQKSGQNSHHRSLATVARHEMLGRSNNGLRPVG